MHTRADYPIAQLADIDAPVFTDMLLHDMGPALADGLTDEKATSSGWRTAPLIGLRFSKVFLHDGRAGNVEEAILQHGGEAQGAADACRVRCRSPPTNRRRSWPYVEVAKALKTKIRRNGNARLEYGSLFAGALALAGACSSGTADSPMLDCQRATSVAGRCTTSIASRTSQNIIDQGAKALQAAGRHDQRPRLGRHDLGTPPPSPR